jgi:predicted peptidase
MEIEFQLRRVEVDGVSHRFRLYVPADYDAAVLFLHGAGERGNDSIAPTKVGLGSALSEREEPFPAIVVFPQCPRETHWTAAAARDIAMAALDATKKEFRIERVALTGISMGAAGAWLMAAEHPERFMSLAPICGWVSARSTKDHADLIARIRGIPTWIFHGSVDHIVPVEHSRVMEAALKVAGADVRYTELRDVAHNSWDPAYGASNLLEWMLNPSAVR